MRGAEFTEGRGPRDSPQVGAPPAPGLAVSGRSAGPPCCATVPGQDRAGPIAPTPLAETPAGESQASRGRERAGAARAGPLAAARARGGRGRAPRVPGGRANGRPAFGKIAIYGHVLGPRAPPPARAARSRLNSGGGGRGRSHSPPPASTARLSAAPSPRPPPVSGPLASLPGPGPVTHCGCCFSSLAPRRSPGRLAGAGAGAGAPGSAAAARDRLGAGRGPAQCAAPPRRGGTGAAGCRRLRGLWSHPGDGGWGAALARGGWALAEGSAALIPWLPCSDRNGRRNCRTRH